MCVEQAEQLYKASVPGLKLTGPIYCDEKKYLHHWHRWCPCQLRRLRDASGESGEVSRANSLRDPTTVYCSGKSYPTHERSFLSAKLKYIPLNANGAQSIPYDIWSLFSAVWNRSDVILLLGVSGAVALPLVRLFSSARIVTNIDGIEWRREKWQGLAKRFLRFSEKTAVRFSHEVIADNAAIAAYVKEAFIGDSSRMWV